MEIMTPCPHCGSPGQRLAGAQIAQFTLGHGTVSPIQPLLTKQNMRYLAGPRQEEQKLWQSIRTCVRRWIRFSPPIQISTKSAAGTSAADGGVQAGDILLQWDDTTLTGGRDLMAVLRSHAPGDTVKLEVNRRGAIKTLSVKLKGRSE